MTYIEILNRYHLFTDALLNPKLRVSEADRLSLVCMRQQLLTTLVAAGIIDNS